MAGQKLDNKGTLTTFLALIFPAILLFAGLILDAARIMIAENKIESALQSTGRSVLAGYDRDLVGEFGLYGVNGTAEEKAREYFMKNLKENHPRFHFVFYNVTDFKMTPVSSERLTEKEVLREQIRQYMKIKGPILVSENILDLLKNSGLPQKAGDFEKSKNTVAESVSKQDRHDEVKVSEVDMKDLFRRLQTPSFLKTIDIRDLAELSSAQETDKAKTDVEAEIKKKAERLSHQALENIVEESGNVTSFLRRLCQLAEEIAGQGRDRLYQNEYIMDKFTFLTSTTLRDHYFDKGEVEYILYGGRTQAGNLAAVAGELFLLRFSLDTVYRFTTSTQTYPIARLVEALMLGFKDAGRDLTTLYRGEGITLFPSSLTGQNSQGSLSYADHLRLLLLLQDEEVQLKRVQELIQVNIRTMKGEGKKAFLLKDHYSSITVSATTQINLWFLPRGYMIEKNVTLHY